MPMNKLCCMINPFVICKCGTAFCFECQREEVPWDGDKRGTECPECSRIGSFVIENGSLYLCGSLHEKS